MRRDGDNEPENLSVRAQFLYNPIMNNPELSAAVSSRRGEKRGRPRARASAHANIQRTNERIRIERRGPKNNSSLIKIVTRLRDRAGISFMKRKERDFFLTFQESQREREEIVITDIYTRTHRKVYRHGGAVARSFFASRLAGQDTMTRDILSLSLCLSAFSPLYAHNYVRKAFASIYLCGYLFNGDYYRFSIAAGFRKPQRVCIC